MPKVLVTCPIFERGWILPRWLDALGAAKNYADISLLFCLTPGADNTEDLIEKARNRFEIEVVKYTGGPEDHSRNWSSAKRVRVIAEKRNMLLDAAREKTFDYLLMLDSDVIAPEGGIFGLVENTRFDGFDAVCPRVWVWNAFYVAAKYRQGRLAFLPRRERGAQAVDLVTSSACLMIERLAKDGSVRYGVAERGKDYGWAPGHEVNGWDASECVYWSKQAKARNYRLGVNCSLTFHHQMSKEAV
jgi:hypothetical protein